MSRRHRRRRVRFPLLLLAGFVALPAVLVSLAAAPPVSVKPAPRKPATAAAPPAARNQADELVRLNNLGIAYLAQYKPAEAERLFREAAAMDPNYIPGLVNTGIAALAQVHYEDAVAAFRKALELEPGNIHARFNLSLIYKIQGKPAEAIAEGTRARESDPRDPDLRYHVGSLHMSMREYDKAIAEFEAVLRVDPNFLSAYYSLGRAWMARGDIEKGKKYVEKHRELQAGSGATPAVGLRYGEQGKYSYAMEDTGGSGPTPQLDKGVVTLVDVSTGSGVDFRHGGGGSLEQLRRPGPSDLTAEALRRSIGSLLGSGVAVADVNADGREDLFFPDASPVEGRSAPALYLNRGGWRFEKASGPGAPITAGPALSAAFGDLDGDQDLDLVVTMMDRVRVLANDGKGSFQDVSAPAGVDAVVSQGLLAGTSLADVDHDGDLDLFVAGLAAAPQPQSSATQPAARTAFPAAWPGTSSFLFLNATAPPPAGQGPGQIKFLESAAKAKVDHAGRRATGAVFGDFDNDRDIDFVLASPADGTSMYSNMRDGTFRDLAAGSGLPSASMVMGLAAADYDKDGWIDLAATTFDGGTPRLFRNMMGDPLAGTGQPGDRRSGAFALDVAAMSDVSRQLAVPLFGIAFADIDNDGYLDLVAVNGSDLGPALFVFRSTGDGRFVDAGPVLGAEQIHARSGRGLAAADLDQDGDLDFVISNSGGPPTLVRNDGGSKNHWVAVAPQGLHSNRGGVGTKVEVKAGRLWQKQELASGSGYLSQSSQFVHFGLGTRTRVDTVRLLWPGGVLQDEVQVKPDTIFAVKELDRKGSSCPILYAFNGASMEFVSDFLGGSAIGARTGPTTFGYPDTEEYVRVTAGQLEARQDRLELRMVNQLEETIFFDRARLLAVDHPGDAEMYPDEKLLHEPPYPGLRLLMPRGARPLAAASDDQGVDLLSALAKIDRRYAEPPPPLRFRGYSRLHTLTLDLGDLPATGPAESPVVLLMHGWIDYADSTSEVGAAQAGVSLVAPYLETFDGTSWVPVPIRVGSPAGLPKTMVIDLTGKLPPGGRLVRITTSMRIYWDQARVATDLAPAASATLTALDPALASLRYRGFPAMISPDGRPPESYDYAKDQGPVHWKTMTGAFTRFGDVRDLLGEVDDRYVITRPGDEVVLEFAATGLPPLAPGYVRDYLLHADGFGKDMDLNSARPDTVGPLPWHDMPSYPPAKGEGFPYGRPGMMEYLDQYQTRLVTSPLPPLHQPSARR